MLMDKTTAASSTTFRALATVVLLVNVAFLAAVACLVTKHGRQHAAAFLRQAKAIIKCAFCSAKAVSLKCLNVAPLVDRSLRRKPEPSSSTLPSDGALQVTATRTESVLKPMLPEKMQSEHITSLSSTCSDSSHS